jgi:adenine deaminase
MRPTAFVHGTGLRRGALATTFSWPHYGLVVVGPSDEELASAANAMRALGGGLVAVVDGETIAAVPFEVGGITGTGPLREMYEELRVFEAAATHLGCRLDDPVTALAALTIPHIPYYGFSDHGLYDSAEQRLVGTVQEG